MTALVLGLTVFIAVHLVPAVAPGLRSGYVEKLGIVGWKALFGLLSLGGLYLVVTGYDAARLQPQWIWQPPAYLSHVTALLMLVSFVFLAAAYVPGNGIKARVGHPMLIGIKTWALAHLLVNGTLADLLLFGSMLGWAVFAFIKHRRADRAAGVRALSASRGATIVTILIGIVSAALFALWLHPMLIGVPAIIRM